MAISWQIGPVHTPHQNLNTTQNCFVSEAFAPFLFRLMERKACVVFKILVFFFSISNIFKKPHHSHHFATQGSPMILWIELCRKPKKAPLNFGYHDVMRTAPMHRYGCACLGTACQLHVGEKEDISLNANWHKSVKKLRSYSSKP